MYCQRPCGDACPIAQLDPGKQDSARKDVNTLFSVLGESGVRSAYDRQELEARAETALRIVAGFDIEEGEEVDISNVKEVAAAAGRIVSNQCATQPRPSVLTSK